MNGYQMAKAKKIAANLASLETSLTRHQLARAISVMTFDQWRTVAFGAGVPVADIQCKAVVLAILRGRAIHKVAA